MSHPLFTVALIAVVAFMWWKFTWPGTRDDIRELAASERKLGPLKFSLVTAGGAGFIGLFAWLAVRLDYPDSYGHPCDGRGCLFHDIRYSTALLRTHHWDEVLLFIFLWLLPATMVAAGIYALLRKLRTTKLSLYSDPTE